MKSHFSFYCYLLFIQLKDRVIIMLLVFFYYHSLSLLTRNPHFKLWNFTFFHPYFYHQVKYRIHYYWWEISIILLDDRICIYDDKWEGDIMTNLDPSLGSKFLKAMELEKRNCLVAFLQSHWHLIYSQLGHHANVIASKAAIASTPNLS